MGKWSEVIQSCLTLCDPIDCNLPGSSVHGIFQQEYCSGLPLLTYKVISFIELFETVAVVTNYENIYSFFIIWA